MGNKLCKAGVKDSSSKERKANRETDFPAAEQQQGSATAVESHEVGVNGEAVPVVTFEQMVLSDSQKSVVVDEVDHLGVVQPEPLMERLTTLRAASHEPVEVSTKEQSQVNGDTDEKVAAASTAISAEAARIDYNTASASSSDERLQPAGQPTAGDNSGGQAASTKPTPTAESLSSTAKQDTSHAPASTQQPVMDGIVEDPTASDEEDTSTIKTSSVLRPEPINDWTEPEAEVKWQPSKRRGGKPPLEQVLSATEADVVRFSATNPFAAATAITSPTNPFADPVLPPSSTAASDKLRFSASNPFL